MFIRTNKLWVIVNASLQTNCAIRIHIRYSQNHWLSAANAKINLSSKAIWAPRESIGQAIFKDAYSFSYDVSLPLKHFFDLVDATKKQLGELPAKVFGFGHIGDSNLHLVVYCSEFEPKVYELLEPFVYEYTSKLCGSISSEHGIGFLKTNYLKFSKKSECMDVMKEVKNLMDPNGILNPYKVLPERFN